MTLTAKQGRRHRRGRGCVDEPEGPPTFSNDYPFISRPGPSLGQPCLTAEPVPSVAASAPSRSTPRSCSTHAAGPKSFNYSARHSEAEALRLLLLLLTPPLLRPPIVAAAIASTAEESEVAGRGRVPASAWELGCGRTNSFPTGTAPAATHSQTRRAEWTVRACVP